MTLMARVDATLKAAGDLLDPPAREPRPFHLRKVWPPDVYSHRFPWALTDRRTGIVGRYATADHARHAIQVRVEATR